MTLAARSGSEIEAGAAAIRGRGGSADALLLDMTDLPETERIITAAEPYEIFVNNAGTNRPKPYLEVTVEDYDAVMGLNVRAAFFAVLSGLAPAHQM